MKLMNSNTKSSITVFFAVVLLTGFLSIEYKQNVNAQVPGLDLGGIPGLNFLKGPKGDTGPQGPAGPKGDTGAAGPKGDTGTIGAAGPKGDTGAAGPKGDKGDKGDTGTIGPAGPAGAPCPHTSNAFEPPQGSSADPPSNIINSNPNGLFCVP